MAVTESIPTHTVDTFHMPESRYKYLVMQAEKEECLTFADWAQREQVLLLRSINSKIGFFVLLVIAGLALALIQAMV